MCYFCISFNTPLLTTHLDGEGFSPAAMGFFLMVVSISYGGTIFCIDFLTNRFSKRGVVFFGMILQNLGINLTGFNSLGHWQMTMLFTIMGLIIFGIGTAMITIPLLPEILDAIDENPRWRGNINEEILQNNVSGYFIFCQATGETCGPLASSFLKLHIRFRPA